VLSKQCINSQILSAPNYEMYHVSPAQDKEETVHSMLTNIYAQCNGRSALLWDTATELSKCGDSKILSAPKYEMCDIARAQDEEEVNSMLTNFMTWASLTRDIEMQRGLESCEASNESIGMPWDVQMCAGDLKLIHRTQPMLGHSDYKFNPQHTPAMSGKETAKIKSRFGLPREKVRKFMSLLKPRPIHWRKIPAELYV